MKSALMFALSATVLLGGTLVASAQVSSGSSEAAQQNLAKKPTDRGQSKTEQTPTTDPGRRPSDQGSRHD